MAGVSVMLDVSLVVSSPSDGPPTGMGRRGGQDRSRPAGRCQSGSPKAYNEVLGVPPKFV